VIEAVPRACSGEANVSKFPERRACDRGKRQRGGQLPLALTPAQQALQRSNRSRLDWLAGQETAQVVSQGVASALAFARGLFRALQANSLQVARDVELQPPRAAQALWWRKQLERVGGVAPETEAVR